MSRQWWPTNPKDSFSVTLTLCACAECIGSLSHLIYLSLTKPTVQQCFHPSAKHLYYKCITSSFVWQSFRSERWNLVLFCQFAVVHFGLISNLFSCRYASRTFRMKRLTLCRVISQIRTFRITPGSGLSLSKYFELMSDLNTKPFIALRVTIFFIRDVDLLCSPR